MSNYIPWYGKKRESLHKREKELAALFRTSATAGNLSEAAEEVRLAKIRALKSKRAQLAPSETSAARQ